ncbi:MAG: tetratricopeptide repeat protein [Methylomarinum sp.]|nr:tetratricopeptide repeat protein [Methylomarinum sp.]
MSIIFSNRNTIKAISLTILFSASFLYSIQSPAATLETDLSKTPFPSIFDDPVTPSYSSPQNELFFDTEAYSTALEKEEKIKALLKSGITRYRAGEKVKGLIDLKKAWKLAPNMASTGVTLAMHYIKDKQYSQALEVAKKQRAIFPTKPYASIIEGFTYHGLENKTQSISAFTQAIKLNPGNSTASLVLANYALKEKNIKQARKLYLDTLSYNPNNMRALLMLSRIDRTQGNTKEIENLVKNAIQTAPDTSLFHGGFAKIYQVLQNYPLALVEIKKAIKSEPNNAANHFLLAKLLVSNNQLNDSRDILNKLALAYPDNPAPRELEGRIALAQNKPKEAINLFQQALGIKDSTSTVMQLATAQIRSGEKESGLSTLRQRVKKESTNILLRKLFADHLSKQNKQEEAIQQYKEIIRLQPNNTIIMNNLAWLLAEQGNIDKALLHIEKAYTITPLNLNIMDTYGTILLKKGLYIKAEEMLNKAIAKAPTNLSIQFHLSQVLVELKKDKTAKILLNKLINTNKPFAEQQEAKKLLEQLESH